MKIFPNVDSFLVEKESNSDAVGIFVNKVLFPIQYSFNDSERLIIFLPGAFDRSKIMPKFMRSNYFADLEEYNCISLFDPTLFLTDKYFSIGWFQGQKESFYMDFLKELIWKIVSLLGIRYENILFFSTSAGGIPAINLASLFEDCKVFAGNIQTNLLNYEKAHVDRSLLYSYDSLDRKYVEKFYSSRVAIDHIDSKFNLFYAQNIADELHYKFHFLPYINQMFRKVKIESVTYNHPVTGHNPLPKHYELKIISALFNESSFKELYSLLQ